MRLGMNIFKETFILQDNEKGLFSIRLQDVTKDFKRLVVGYCSESREFEVDGMKFRATCERIE